MSKLAFVRYLPQPGKEEAVEKILRGMVNPTRSEPGNQIYDLFKAETAEGRVIYHLFERFTDEAAVNAHRETAHYKVYRETIVPLLEDPIGVALLTPLDARAL